MLQGKTITIASVAWGDQVQATLAAVNHCSNIFPYFDQAIIFSNFSLSLKFASFQLQFRNVWVNGMLEFNRFMVESIDYHISTDYVLIVQSDGYILHPELWKDKFLDYDYIGAPWSCYGVCGNGGFSLRSKKFLASSSLLKYDAAHDFFEFCPEDSFLCLDQFHRGFMIQNGIRYADLETSLDFSFENPMESYPGRGLGQSFGFHGKFHLGKV